jgi:hypothetical protein
MKIAISMFHLKSGYSFIAMLNYQRVCYPNISELDDGKTETENRYIYG